MALREYLVIPAAERCEDVTRQDLTGKFVLNAELSWLDRDGQCSAQTEGGLMMVGSISLG